VAETGGVAVLTYRRAWQYAVVNTLAAHCDVRLVIYERQTAATALRMLARRVRRAGIGRVAAQLAYIALDRLWLQAASQPAIRRMLAAHNTNPPPPSLPQLEVASINDEAVAEALRAAQPAVVVVSGTSLIQRRILALAPVFLNMHTGITPRYRGAHGAFWAVWEGRPDLAGVTVHLVDAGIDTGAIVAQAAIALEAGDTPRTLAVRQTLAGVPLLVDAAQAALDNSLTTRRRADLESRLWQTPTPLAYLQFRRQLALLARAGQLGQGK
jgi:folate-dependent phosphoribosylglycinamide formyltransferase PurN